jgi:L-arabinose isomerase
MGEINIDLTDDKPVLLEKTWRFTDAEPPIFPSASLKDGEAVFADLAPGPDNSFSLILSPVTMVAEKDASNLEEMVRGWMKPRLPIADFLASYSRVGGTHHAAVAYGDVIQELKTFGMTMGWDVVVLG